MTIENLTEIFPVSQDQIKDFLTVHWGASFIVSRGKVHDYQDLKGFGINQNGTLVGLVTYQITDSQLEIISLDATVKAQGIGSVLVQHLIERASHQQLTRIWLITTNDNLDALRFYQRKGFYLVAIHQNAIEKARKIKPSIPLIGAYGIPIRDEIELEYRLSKHK